MDESFGIRHFGDCFAIFQNRFLRIADDAHPFDEIINAERTGEACGSIRREHMIGACKIIADRLT